MKKVSIVFEETGEVDEKGNHKFNVYLDGLSKERRDYINSLDPEKQLQELSTVEFWGLRCFQIVGGILTQTGAKQEERRR